VLYESTFIHQSAQTEIPIKENNNVADSFSINITLLVKIIAKIIATKEIM
jgi:hypothetical protein